MVNSALLTSHRSPLTLPCFLALALGLSVMTARGEEAWKTYINERWGFSLSYPSSLVAGPVPANGAGREFHSSEVSLIAQGSFTQQDETLDSFWSKELSQRGDTITYRLRKANYYVISGVNANGYEFYHKVFFFSRRWIEFEITYPHARNNIYDPWVERIAKEFNPVLPDNGQYDR
jgi:hypothetical protein